MKIKITKEDLIEYTVSAAALFEGSAERVKNVKMETEVVDGNTARMTISVEYVPEELPDVVKLESGDEINITVD